MTPDVPDVIGEFATALDNVTARLRTEPKAFVRDEALPSDAMVTLRTTLGDYVLVSPTLLDRFAARAEVDPLETVFGIPVLTRIPADAEPLWEPNAPETPQGGLTDGS